MVAILSQPQCVKCSPSLSDVGQRPLLTCHVGTYQAAAKETDPNQFHSLSQPTWHRALGQPQIAGEGLKAYYHRADSRFSPNQWEEALLCNNISHWLGASLESALDQHKQLRLQSRWRCCLIRVGRLLKWVWSHISNIKSCWGFNLYEDVHLSVQRYVAMIGGKLIVA